MQKKNAYTFFVGTYTNGDSEGIYKYLLEKDGTMKRVGLVSVSDNPSFLTMSVDKKYLIAVNETNHNGAGTVESFLIKDDRLVLISRSSSGGADPCYITTDERGFVLVANYNGGNLGLLRLDKSGELSALLDVEQHTGSGTTNRQKGPHAHSVFFEPEGSEIISLDLGTNELWFSHLNTDVPQLIPSGRAKLKLHPGAGPRHLTFHPNGKWIYVVNELDCTVTIVRKHENRNYETGASISTLPDAFKKGYSCADIHITSDGKFVYASNRGHDSIVIYEVAGEDGSLSLIGHQSTNGETPRNFSLSPDDNFLLVANQSTNNIVSFKRNESTGLLTYVTQIEAPTPVCILF